MGDILMGEIVTLEWKKMIYEIQSTIINFPTILAVKFCCLSRRSKVKHLNGIDRCSLYL